MNYSSSSPKVVLDYFRTRLLCTISKSDFSYTAAQENPLLSSTCCGDEPKSFVKRTDEVISCILSPYSNGKMEGTNNKIKLIKRRGYGYRNIHRFALRVCLETANIL
ncbi:hypothetical protein AF2641_01310 [Anoxybacillus flavithermus]|nr:hypothetical protein AF2641_01310 [Anoxybacillus flavithermus]